MRSASLAIRFPNAALGCVLSIICCTIKPEMQKPLPVLWQDERGDTTRPFTLRYNSSSEVLSLRVPAGLPGARCRHP